jgi:hypothetical protein
MTDKLHEEESFLEANSHSASQEIPQPSWDLNIHYCVSFLVAQVVLKNSFKCEALCNIS